MAGKERFSRRGSHLLGLYTSDLLRDRVGEVGRGSTCVWGQATGWQGGSDMSSRFGTREGRSGTPYGEKLAALS